MPTKNVSGSPLGVALSLTEIVAVDSRVGATRQWRMALEAPNAENSSWPSLTVALRTLATLTREQNGKLAIALLSPISETRKLDLPPLPDDELESVLARNAARYFVGARGAQVTSVAAAGNRAEQGVVAATVPAFIVRFVTAAVRDAGWSLSQLVPAEAAWSIAAIESWPAAAKGSAAVLVHHTDRTDVLQLRDRELVNVRRLRAAVSAIPVLLESLTPAQSLYAMGDAGTRKEWASALSARGLTVAPPSGMSADVANDSALLAAAFVVDVDTMMFRTEEMRVADRARRNRLMWTLVATSAVMLLAAAGFSYWDVKRELTAIQAARASIKPQLATTMVGRTSVETVSGQLQMLATTERESPRWSTVISELTEHLPEDSYLLSLRGRSDTVLFEGMAEHAAKVFPALQGVQSFVGVKAAASVRREAGESGEALERFTLAAKLRSAPTVEKPLSAATPRTTASGAP